jgi:plasmid stabilization system protein ParE
MRRYKIRLLPSANDDLKNARNWYKQHNALLPGKFKQQVQDGIERIKVNPYAFAVRYKNVHIAKLNIFPYAIHYLVNEEAETVIVLAIHHTALSPEKWQNRLK